MYSVLYVDDEPELLELGKLFLEGTGEFSVETQTSPLKALEELKDRTFDVVVADYQMPGLDGIALLKEVRAKFGKIPFILFTGKGREEVVIEAINNGADFYLQKGGEPRAQFAELSHKIRQAISRWETESELSAARDDIQVKLQEQTIIAEFSKFILKSNSTDEILDKYGDLVFSLSGADYGLVAKLNPSDNTIRIHRLYGFPALLQKVWKLLMTNPDALKIPPGAITSGEGAVLLEPGLKKIEGGIYIISGKHFPLAMCRTVEKVLGIEALYDDSFIWGSELCGGITLGFGPDKDLRKKEVIDMITRLTANALWRIFSANITEESEVKFRSLVENSLAGIVIVDFSGTILFANPRAGTVIAGEKYADLIGKSNVLDFVPPGYREDVLSDLAKVVSGIENFLVTYPVHTISTKDIWVECIGKVITFESSPAIFLSIQDITDRKLAEDQLRAAYEQRAATEEELHSQYDELKRSQEFLRDKEHFLRSIFGSIQDGISILDMTMTVIQVNATMERWYEHEKPLIGRKCYEVYHGREERCEVCPSYQTLQTGKPAVETVPLVDEGLIKGWLELYSFPFIDSDTGQMKGVIEYVRNISGRKKAEDQLKDANEQLTAAEEELRGQYAELALNEQRLRESEEKYRTLVESTSDLIWEVDRDGRYSYVSPKIREFLGYEQDEVIGRTPFSLMPPAEAERVKGVFEECISSLKPLVGLENTNTHKDGHPVVLETSGEPILDPGGNLAGYRGVDRDITERKRAEEELKAANEQLTAAEEELRGQYAELAYNEQRLRESEEKYRTLVERSQDGVVIVQDERLAFANGALTRMIGFTEEELFGHSVEEFIAPEDLDLVMGRHRERFSGRTVPDSYEYSLLHKDGKTRVRIKMFAGMMNYQGKPALIGTFHDVTLERRREEALRESEKRYHDLADLLPQMIFEMDPELRITYANRYALGLFGVTEETLRQGVNAFSFIDPSEHTRVRENLEKVLKGEIPGNREFTFRRIDGSTFPVLIYTAPVFRDRDPVGFRGVAVDISARKKMEEELREKAEELGKYFESALDLLCIADTDGYFRRLNREWEKVLGYPLDELIGHRFLDFVHPDDREATREALAQLESQKEILNFTNRYRCRDGTYRWIEWRSFPSGKKIYAAARDITDRRKIQEELEEGEERYRLLLQNANDAVYIHEVLPEGPGLFLEVNDTACRMLGYSRDELLRMSPRDIDAPERRGLIPDILTELFAKKNALFQTDHITKDGHRIPVEISNNLFWLHGRPTVLSIVRDISDRKRAEEALRRVNEKLNLLNSITRHDVANQLTILQSLTELALMTNSDPAMTDYLTKIEAAGTKIARQIEFTRTYQKLGLNDPDWFDIKEVLSKVMPKNIGFFSTCAGLEIFADPMLENVFSNLFDNAIRHGERVKRIIVSCQWDPDKLTIVVEDNGAGIPPDEKEKIFEKGYGRNTGFGLFLAREILAITGISIRETGEYGSGARFEITVPERGFRSVF
jgi:PAS domain S-box-containing protein